ncbi:PAS domain-containing sensor histidine kinase [Clostridium thermarum]|uniref:sensor histidine kinase n=1 Tax=Clostridium thermarum TaxID=1716543 RepID=UPI0011205179|nr:PAS domain-containing sensor histidine kinase [Clostridium thermarum]
MESKRSFINSDEKYLLSFDTSIFDMINDGVIIKREDTIIFCNPSARKILYKRCKARIEGMNISELITPTFDYQKTYEEYLEKTKTNIEVLPTSITFYRKCDGREIALECSSRKIYCEGNTLYLEVMKPLSKETQEEIYRLENEKTKKLLAEALECDRIKTEFFENLSHEFRTPLNVILGIIQLQDHVYKNNDFNNVMSNYKKYNEILKQNCYRLVRMINNVLDMTKIESGYMILNLKNANIVNTVEDITMSVVDYAKSLGIRIIFDTDVEEKYMAFDADNMERIILNLLSNAVKFTPEGRCVYVTVKDKDENVVISIKDEGEGIPREKQKFMFKRFMQGHSNMEKKRAGTGIGLSLVKSLVELHGGKISFKSELGKGSEFIITLPVYTVEEKESGSDFKMPSQNNVERVSIEFSDIYNLNV